MPEMPSNKLLIGPAKAGLITAMAMMLANCVGTDVA